MLFALASTTATAPVTAQVEPIVTNGSFEEGSGNRIADWLFQDAPGVRTVIDSNVARVGEHSLRAELTNGEMSRAQTTVAVEANTDYVATVWMRAQDATTDNWGLLVRDSSTREALAPGRINATLPNGEAVTPWGANEETFDWVQAEVSFNSGSSTELLVMLAAWGGQSGQIWWDDLRVERASSDPGSSEPTNEIRDNWLHMSANLVVDDVDDLLETIDEARAAGATGVLFSDTKASNFGRFGYGSWPEDMARLADEVQSRDMDFVPIIAPLGFCNSLLADNVDLAAGYPVVDQPMVVRGGQLIPAESTTVARPSFENIDGNTVPGWSFQDAPGQRTFVDNSVARTGSSSFRADARNGEMSRLFGDVEVEPNRQYTVSAWVRTSDLTARNVALLVLEPEAAEGEERRNYTNQNLSLPGDDNRREFFTNTNGLTTGWTEMRLSFNSMDATEVRLGLAVFGGTSGSIWWDDIAVEATPTLNWLNRDGLDQSIVTADGRSLEIGVDTSVIDDPLLGESRFSGTYDSYHAAPVIEVEPSAGLQNGDRVLLSGWHTMVTTNGQIGCSWNDPAVFDLIEELATDLHQLVEADGYLINYSEVRTGGFEPTDTAFGSSGAAFAASATRAFDIVDQATGDADLYSWSDMFDPFHNARENYYQVAGDLSGSWEGLDPERVTIINWWSGDNLREPNPDTVGTSDPASNAELSVQFFSDEGFEQMIGGFYDEDVQDNYDAWVEATEGVNTIGSVYATWVRPRNFDEIEAFGELWWQ